MSRKPMTDTIKMVGMAMKIRLIIYNQMDKGLLTPENALYSLGLKSSRLGLS
jgi:hypothetical protein